MPEPTHPLLTLYTFEKLPPKTHSISPFVAKLHFRLRHAGIPFETAHGSRGQAPNGKIPYVKFHEPLVHNDNASPDAKGTEKAAAGTLMGDSALITRHLVAAGRLPDLTTALSPAERARDLAVRALVEDRMYFLFVRERWKDNFAATVANGPYKWLPWGARHVMAGVGYVFCRAMLHLQGVGRYGDQECERMVREGLGALEAMVVEGTREGKGSGKVGWVLGREEATEADFALFGMLIGVRGSPMHPAGGGMLKEHPALVSYLERILKTYYPDFEEVKVEKDKRKPS